MERTVPDIKYVPHNYKVVYGSRDDVRKILSVPGVASMHNAGSIVTVSHAGPSAAFSALVHDKLGGKVVLELITDKKK